MENIQFCPICSKKRFDTFITSKDFFLTGEEFKIVKCSACGFRFTNPRPTFDEIGAYYKSEEYISHTSQGKNLFSKVYNIIRNYSIRNKIRKIKNFKKEGRALDIGCGSGEFLNELSKQGFTVEGIEPNLNAGSAARENYGLTINPELNSEFASVNTYDLITLWHVLEHVHNLKQYIGFIDKMLSETGYLIIAVPNYESFDAEHYKEFWAAYDLPRHLYHFDQKTIRMLLSQNNLEIVETYPMKFDSFYVSLLSEKYWKNKSRPLHAFLIGLKSNFKARKNNKNYSSLIYVVKAKKG